MSQLDLDRRRFVLAGASLFAGISAPWSAVRAAGTPGLTTHMLDTASGIPAAGVRIDFSVLEDGKYRLVRTVHTNEDGRTEPLLTAETMKTGQYQLVFYIAEYFTKRGVVLPKPPFLETAVIQFGISDATSHYHVPLLASPWSYTTYRGS
jgi:5-hydroxyisourate hydrolase